MLFLKYIASKLYYKIIYVEKVNAAYFKYCNIYPCKNGGLSTLTNLKKNQ